MRVYTNRKRRRRIRKRRIISKEEKAKSRQKLILSSLLGVIISAVILIIYRNELLALGSLFGVPLFLFIFMHFRKVLKHSAKVKKIETIFPDFLQLMSSNLRAGLTIDKAIILSSREEFAPLDQEIFKTGKEIATGKETETALLNLSKRIGSEKVHKTILLIISGMRAGGNLAVLLEETSVNMRERGFVEKRAASNVLMYVIFIFVAVAFGAPALFSLSGILVETLSGLLTGVGDLSSLDFGGRSLPFTLSSVNISLTFIKYFSLVFITITDLLASLIIGLVRDGEEKEGLKYFLPLWAISLTVFFVTKGILEDS